MGVCVTPLKVYRRDLSAHLAAGLGTADTALGAKMNPPATVVQPSSDVYLTVEPGYCVDGIDFDVAIVAPAGDAQAQFDALDDLIDKVRATLLNRSPAGYKYALRQIGGLTNYAGPDGVLPAVVATVHLERETH